MGAQGHRTQSEGPDHLACPSRLRRAADHHPPASETARHNRDLADDRNLLATLAGEFPQGVRRVTLRYGNNPMVHYHPDGKAHSQRTPGFPGTRHRLRPQDIDLRPVYIQF